VLTQSLAILEWLEETRPEPPLLPVAPAERAAVRAMSLAIACDIHSLNNLRVLARLSADFGADEAADRSSALEAFVAAHPSTQPDAD